MINLDKTWFERVLNESLLLFVESLEPLPLLEYLIANDAITTQSAKDIRVRFVLKNLYITLIVFMLFCKSNISFMTCMKIICKMV